MGGGVIPFMRTYSTICPYPSEIWARLILEVSRLCFRNVSMPSAELAVALRDLRLLLGKHSTATGAPSGHRAQGCWVRQVDARDLDDGLPRGFLVGAIVKVRVAHRLNWACELPWRRGEELP